MSKANLKHCGYAHGAKEAEEGCHIPNSTAALMTGVFNSRKPKQCAAVMTTLSEIRVPVQVLLTFAKTCAT